MLWFTSDTHFYHENIIKLDGRPFASLEEMHETIISRWNEVIAKGDVVYHLGDFALTSNKDDINKVTRLLKRLNGQVFLICGNHDRKPVKRAPFVWVGDYKRIKVGDQHIVLSHYPIRSWHGMQRGVFHLHGHSHGNLFDIGGYIKDVGTMTNQFYPYCYDEIYDYMEGREFVRVDHHGLHNEEILSPH